MPVLVKRPSSASCIPSHNGSAVVSSFSSESHFREVPDVPKSHEVRPNDSMDGIGRYACMYSFPTSPECRWMCNTSTMQDSLQFYKRYHIISTLEVKGCLITPSLWFVHGVLGIVSTWNRWRPHWPSAAGLPRPPHRGWCPPRSRPRQSETLERGGADEDGVEPEDSRVLHCFWVEATENAFM